ncbi:MAG: hypothetical protein Q8P55_00965 [bacterium]|nr:hypothetical protein [bacterium]
MSHMSSVISHKSSETGVSLYISFMIMTALLGIAFGVSTLLFSQLGILRGMGYSVFAFYATEAGLERALYIDNTVCLEVEVGVSHAPCLVTEFASIPLEDLVLSNGASYQLKAESPGELGCTDEDPPGYNFCVKATGIYENARRAVRVAR